MGARTARLTQQQAEQLQENAVSRLTLAGERDIINYAKPIEMLNFSAIPSSEEITQQKILEELEKSSIGKEIL